MMKSSARIGTIVLSLAATGAVFAQAPAPATPAPTKDHAAHAQFGTVDQNKDGRVSQTEAQAHTELTSAFPTLDADKDTYLSQSEFAKWNQMGMGKGAAKDKGASSYSTPKTEPAAK